MRTRSTARLILAEKFAQMLKHAAGKARHHYQTFAGLRKRIPFTPACSPKTDCRALQDALNDSRLRALNGRWCRISKTELAYVDFDSMMLEGGF